MLLPSQKNQLRMRLANSHLDPDAFTLEAVNGPKRKQAEKAERIKHLGSDYYFTIEIVGEDRPTFYYEFFPSENRTRETNLATGFNTFNAVLDRFDKWIEVIKAEFAIVDLWNLKGRFQTAITKVTSQPDNRPIEPDEIDKITENLEAFRKYLGKTQLMSEDPDGLRAKMEQIDANIDFLIDALPRFGRKDYMALFLSFVINIVSAITVSESAAQAILSFSKEVYQILFSADPHYLN
jgi:hypothetical protein